MHSRTCCSANVVERHLAKKFVNNISPFGKKTLPNGHSWFENFAIDHSELTHSESLVSYQFVHKWFDISPVLRQPANSSPKTFFGFRRERSHEVSDLSRPLNFSVHPEL